MGTKPATIGCAMAEEMVVMIKRLHSLLHLVVVMALIGLLPMG